MVPYVGVSTALQFMFSLYLVSGDEGSAAEEWADAARSAQQVSFNLGATGRTMANDTAPSRLSLRDRRRRRGASNEPSVSPVSPVPPRRSGGSRGAGTFSRNVLLLREEAQDEMARPPRSTVKQAIIDDGRACTITFNIDMMGPDIVRAVRNAMQSRYTTYEVQYSWKEVCFHLLFFVSYFEIFWATNFDIYSVFFFLDANKYRIMIIRKGGIEKILCIYSFMADHCVASKLFNVPLNMWCCK